MALARLLTLFLVIHPLTKYGLDKWTVRWIANWLSCRAHGGDQHKHLVGGCEEDRVRLNHVVEKAAVLYMQVLLISDTETASFDGKCTLRAVVPKLQWVQLS